MSILSRRRFLGAAGSVALLRSARSGWIRSSRGCTDCARSASASAVHPWRTHITATDVRDVRGSDVQRCRPDSPSAPECLRSSRRPGGSRRHRDQRLDHGTVARARPREHGQTPGCGKRARRPAPCRGDQQRCVGLVERRSNRCYLYSANVPGMKTQRASNSSCVRQSSPWVTTRSCAAWNRSNFRGTKRSRTVDLAESDRALRIRRSIVQQSGRWLGRAAPEARVVCLQPGHTRHVCQDPNYRDIVHRSVQWAGGRLS